MHPTRRQILAALAATAALPGCGGYSPGPDPDVPWEPDGTVDDEAFAWGVQVGDATDVSAIVSLRTTEGAVVLEVVVFTKKGWEPLVEDARTVDETGAVQLILSDLLPDSTHALVCWSADRARRTVVTRFRTAPPAGENRVVRFGATSCLGGNEPWPILSRAAEEQLDAFLLLGDTIYADWGARVSYDEKWDEALAMEGMRDLCASTSLVATWDDHEVRNNWDPERASDAEMAVEALAAFRRAIPQGTGPTGGIWRSLRWGNTVELFVLDCRGERFEGRYMSQDQLDWLKDGLVASPARFKLVLNSVPLTDLSFIPMFGEIEADDRWQGYPAQRTELLQHIADAGVTGILWLSGDFHIGAVAKIDPDDGPGAGQIEVLTGPGGSAIAEEYAAVTENSRILAVVRDYNYVLFRCDPDAGEIAVSYVGNEGEVLEREIVVL